MAARPPPAVTKSQAVKETETWELHKTGITKKSRK